MKKTAWVTLISFVLVLLAGCIIVSRPSTIPPPPRKEIRIVKPGPDYVWISGHWKWARGKYTWVAGYWTKARLGKIWVPGRWARRDSHWVWIRGYWKKKR